MFSVVLRPSNERSRHSPSCLGYLPQAQLPPHLQSTQLPSQVPEQPLSPPLSPVSSAAGTLQTPPAQLARAWGAVRWKPPCPEGIGRPPVIGAGPRPDAQIGQ